MKILVKKMLAKLFYKIINSNEFNNLKKSSYTFKSLGINAAIPTNTSIKNAQYISIGNNFFALDNLRIEAWDAYLNETFKPEISIGNNVSFNTDIHIGCINKVVIGNNVLLASRIYISDHSHGEITKKALEVPPAYRSLISAGAVIIEDNVWIGEGVAILPNVTIGKNSIIGANAVVTKSFPPNCVIAGVPAKIIKMLT